MTSRRAFLAASGALGLAAVRAGALTQDGTIAFRRAQTMAIRSREATFAGFARGHV
jgi:hypothetical protein